MCCNRGNCHCIPTNLVLCERRWIAVLAFPIKGRVCSRNTAAYPPWQDQNGLAETLQVSPNFPIPLNAVIVSFLCGIVISLIYLGSSVALNAIVSLTISALLASYVLSIGCVLSKRLRGEPLPAARWSLGRAGTAINIIALVFLIPFFIFCFFPTATPVQPDTMNWNSLMFGAIFLWATGYYAVKGRKVYVPPVRILKRDV